MSIYKIELERDRLHLRVGGGFQKGSINLIVGKFGSGKSIIVQRFAYGFLSNQHTVTYVSTELSMREFIEQMDSLDFFIDDYLLHGKLLYVPVYPVIGRAIDRSGFLGNLTSKRAYKMYSSDIIIIDTLSSLIGQNIEGRKKALDVLAFFKKLSETTDKTIIFTVDTEEMGEEILTPFKSVCDGYLSIETVLSGGTLFHKLTVNRLTAASGKVFGETLFRVEPKIGVVVEISQIV